MRRRRWYQLGIVVGLVYLTWWFLTTNALTVLVWLCLMVSLGGLAALERPGRWNEDRYLDWRCPVTDETEVS